MAEPIILAFGRGDLPDFPGIPDGVIDIIPVDLVVNAMHRGGRHAARAGLAGVLHDLLRRPKPAELPAAARPGVRVTSSSTRWCSATAARSGCRAGSGRGRSGSDQLIRLGDRAHRTADRVVTSLPRSARTRDWARSLDRQRGRLDFLRRYFDLYRPYADAELHFSDRSTLALHEALHPDDVEPFGFDATMIDWRYYLVDVHVPAVVAPLTALSALRGPRTEPTRQVAENGSDTVAVFDMDGTLLSSNVVESYLWLRLPELAMTAKAREVGEVARALPRWLVTQRRDRAAFLRMVYRRYEGARSPSWSGSSTTSSRR